MNANQMWQELETLDRDDLAICTLTELYKQAIPRHIQKMTGCYPDTDRKFRINQYESFASNCERFQRDILNKHFDGNAEKYTAAQRIGQFRLEGNKFYSFRQYGKVSAVLDALRFIVGGNDTDKELGAIENDILHNTDRPVLADSWSWNKAVIINGHTFNLKGFKNGYIQIKNLDEVQAAKFAELCDICRKPR